jgi:transposase-like protein
LRPIGCTAQTLNEWVKRAERDSGVRAGIPIEVAERLKALERENRELRQANEILRKAESSPRFRPPTDRQRDNTRLIMNSQSRSV